LKTLTAQKLIHAMNLSSIDLNLLVVFDALMRYRQVTLAGQQLGLSQPATSNALARLRKLLNDELFVRGYAGLQPTPKALMLADLLQPALSQIQAAMTAQESFEPAISEITFRIGMSDYVEFTLLPALLKEVQRVAPKVGLQIRSGDRTQQLDMLNKSELDLICGLFPEKVDAHRQQRLFNEEFVCVCRDDHPYIQGKLSLEDYLTAHHLLVSVKEDRQGRIDYLLAKQNLQRHVAISVPHFLVAPALIAQTDLITTMAKRVADAFADVYRLQILPIPVSVKGFGVFMRWHKSNEDTPSQRWLRSIVTKVSTVLDRRSL
jgi:DNA-binding transcriptional LysR family regulator